ncbi:MAG: response regulator [Nostocaceae cyanobacterium]|nr:response regulator [Nostocaceae cyanobacterium]
MVARIKRTVLVVDDSPEDCEMYQRYLGRDFEYDYTILFASQGQEGLELWQQHQPDVVLLDYRLPDLDGLECLAAIQTQGQLSPLPVIMVTGEGNETIAVQAIKAGAQDYLVKGKITPESLRLAVNGTIKAVELQTQLQWRSEREKIVAQIAQKVNESLILDDVLQTTVEEVRQFLHTDRVVIFKVEPNGNGSVLAESIGAQWRAIQGETIYDPCMVEGYIQHYRQGLVTAKTDIYDGSVTPCHVTMLAEFQVRANLVVPILHDQEFWGLLIAHHCSSPRQWHPLETDLLQQLATQVSIAIRQAELYQQTQHELAQRQRTEEVLRDKEEKLRSALEFKNRILESSTDCIKVLSLDARLLYMNAGGMCLLEIEDLTPYLNSEWLCFWQDEYRQAATTAIATAKSGELGKFQGFCPTAKGQPKWWDVVVTPVRDAAGEVVQILSISRDITEQKQTVAALQEQTKLLQVIVSSMGDGLIAANQQGELTIFNQAAERIFGQLANQHFADEWASTSGLFLPDQQTLFSQDEVPLARALSGEVVTDVEMFVRRNRPANSGQWISASAYPLVDETQQLKGGIVVCRDITERKQAEIERERILQLKQAALAEAERINRIKDEFLAILSHELRSPLNPILGWTKLIKTGRLDETKTAAALDTIERNAKLQTQLIDDLLDMARILRGKLSLESSPVSLSLVIESALDTVKTAANAKSIIIHPVLPDIGQVAGDAVRLQQVVWNLLSNAIKFTPDGGRVDIRLERVDNQAQLKVSDTGKGIHPNFLPYIFESFRQEDTSVTRNYGGLGLGLAIVYQLVEAHGGTITAASPGEGKGATFTVRVPLLKTKLKSNQPPKWELSELDLTGVRVLTIDDEPDSRELLSALLSASGAVVMTVTSAAEFLSALESFSPDILVSDIGMPGVDGYSLLKQVRSLPPERGGQIPAIALTAYAGEIDQQRAIAAGFQIHISKPVEPEQLLTSIAELLHNSVSAVAKLATEKYHEYRAAQRTSTYSSL